MNLHEIWCRGRANLCLSLGNCDKRFGISSYWVIFHHISWTFMKIHELFQLGDITGMYMRTGWWDPVLMHCILCPKENTDYNLARFPSFLAVHSQFMTNLRVGQVVSCWSNVSRLGFDQHVGQLTNLWQWVTLTLTKIWPR